MVRYFQLEKVALKGCHEGSNINMVPGGVVVVDVGSVLFVESAPVVVLDVAGSVGTLVLTSSASGDMMKGGCKINVKGFITISHITTISHAPLPPAYLYNYHSAHFVSNPFDFMTSPIID